MTATTTIPLPPGAVEALSDWEHDGHGGLIRVCAGQRHGTDAVSFRLVMEQEYGGEVLQRTVSMNDGTASLDAAALRALGTDILAAADELDGLPAPAITIAS